MKPIINLNEKIKIIRLDKQNNIVISETPGKTISEEPDFAVTRIYNSHNQYSITHKPTGVLCMKGYYNSLKELNKHLESDIKQAKQYIEGNKEKIQQAIERFNKYNKDDENTSQTFSDVHKQQETDKPIEVIAYKSKVHLKRNKKHIAKQL